MGMRKLLWLWMALTLGVLVYGFYLAIFVAPADAEQGNVFRIFFYHVPSAIMGLVFPYVNFIAALFYLGLRRRNPLAADKADALALAAAEVALVFTTICLASGMLWGRAAWGIWWAWDARLTSLLLLWLLYVAYLTVRRFSSTGQTQTLAAIISVFAAVDVPIVYMSIRWWRTQHPAPVFFGGPDSGVDPSMMPAFLWNFLGWSMWGVFLVSLRYGLERMRQARARSIALHAVEAGLEGNA
jgi:heme exporter protein C